jgi:hypothetical protein
MTPCRRGHTEGRFASGGCKGCVRENSARFFANRTLTERRALNTAAKRKYYAKDSRHDILGTIRRRAAQTGTPFDITVDDIVTPNFCPVLGIPLKVSKGRPGPNSPSVDKMIPELGYVRGNVAVISFKANCMKQNGTPEELRAVADWLERVYPQWLLTGKN